MDKIVFSQMYTIIINNKWNYLHASEAGAMVV
jgi:hypothetical protein